MFETLFSYRWTVRRHREGPLVVERLVYLERAASRGHTYLTLRWKASYALGVARALQSWPAEHLFSRADLDALIASWKKLRCGAGGQAFSPKHFRNVAIEFLTLHERLMPKPRSAVRHEDLVEDFIAAQRERGWQSSMTCDSARGQIRQFLIYAQSQRRRLKSVDIELVDGYFQHVGARWKRASIRQAANCLRAWFRHCEAKGWARAGLARGILRPRLYRQEEIPLGPSWDEIGRAIALLDGDEPVQLRDRAIFMMLAVYGLRSGELLRLKLEDIDWRKQMVRLVRSKSGRVDAVPLEASVGNAIARYLRDGRPQIDSRTIFLRIRAPHRPMSAAGLYSVIRHNLLRVTGLRRGFGPHGLRHACARRLVEAGLSFKEVGDHLGHRSPEATAIYAKVDLPSLRLVAFEAFDGLGGRP